MQNAKKTVVAKKDQTPAATPVAATPAAAPVKKGPAAKKEVAKKEVVPAPEPASDPMPSEPVVVAAPPSEPVVAAVEEVPAAAAAAEIIVTEEGDVIKEIDAEIDSLENMRKELTVRLQNMRKIRKTVLMMSKKVTKKGGKKNANKKPSGINLGFPIADVSAPLAAFMKEQSGKNDLATVSRIDALKSINAYIKTKALQNPANKQNINLDANMKKLFPTYDAAKNPLRYKDIMGALGQHFPKKAE